MDAKNLTTGNIYTYTGGDETVKVMYTGKDSDRYGFRSYNEETAQYNGFYNTLNVLDVLILIK